MARISVDWPPREGLSQGDFACSEVSLVRTPNHTRCTVATGPAVGEDTQNDPRSLTLADCKTKLNRKGSPAFFSSCRKVKKGFSIKIRTHKCIFLALCLNAVQSDSEKSGAAHPKFKNSSLVLMRLVSAKYSVKIRVIAS